VKHWSRLLDGELYATSSRLDWAVLMRRTLGFDALRCPTCDALMRVRAAIADPILATDLDAIAFVCRMRRVPPIRRS
jgi:hypothetical protein